MKPENILVGKDGYLKLSDFGLAKNAKESNTFCGTPEYISPEILLGTGHDHTSDWWALGVLIYEMLTGIPPFYDKNRNMMFLNIERANIRWPNEEKHGISVGEVAKDLIERLLEKDKSLRLGANGGDEVLAHPFFSSINLNELMERNVKAPFRPMTTDPDKMRQSCKQIVKLKNLEETLIPSENIQLIKNADKEVFNDFGCNIDKTQEERLLLLRRDS